MKSDETLKYKSKPFHHYKQEVVVDSAVHTIQKEITHNTKFVHEQLLPDDWNTGNNETYNADIITDKDSLYSFHHFSHRRVFQLKTFFLFFI